MEQIGKYEIVGILGSGSMGAVYKGYDRRLDRHVALKLMSREILSDPTSHARFLKEAKALARLHHPHIVTIHEMDEWQNLPYIVMEFLQGHTLKKLRETGKALSLYVVVRILREAAEGLFFAHQQGVIHRDVKPANIMIGADGNLKIVDFGIARFSESSFQTQAGVTLGTAAYMSPEQARGETVDPRTDQYSLGIIAYELFCGAPPFKSNSVIQLMQRIAYEPVPPIPARAQNGPPALYSLVMRMLEHDRGKRFPELGPVIGELASIQDQLQQQPAPTPPPGMAAPPSTAAPQPLLAPPPPPARRPATGHAVAPPQRPAGGRSPSLKKPAKRGGWKRFALVAAGVFALVVASALAVLLLSHKKGRQAVAPPFTNRFGMKFVQVKAGSFTMGSEEILDARPARAVALTRDFYLQETETTQAQWKALMSANPSEFEGDDLPVENVSWDEVQEFVRRLNGPGGGGEYRLPTEAEWEYACRSGSDSPFYWGGEIDGAFCWYASNSGGRAHPVGSKRSNAWGLKDMAGNVWEWCSDWYGEGYYATGPRVDPPGPVAGTLRVLRGGSWFDDVNDAYNCRSASRFRLAPGERRSFAGFRLVARPK